MAAQGSGGAYEISTRMTALVGGVAGVGWGGGGWGGGARGVWGGAGW